VINCALCSHVHNGESCLDGDDTESRSDGLHGLQGAHDRERREGRLSMYPSFMNWLEMGVGNGRIGMQEFGGKRFECNRTATVAVQ
jgi:hypothetical protein